MNLSEKEIVQLEQRFNSEMKDDSQQVSQPIAKPNVVGSLVGQREIKFRVWDNVDYMSSPFTIHDVQNKIIQFTADCPIMQFTGLKDKNGKEIYEWDFVKIMNPYNGLMALGVAKVVFSYEYAGGWVATTDGKYFLNIGTRTDSIEVAGNVFETPELFKTVQ